MAVNVKLGVEFSQFTAGMREGQTQLKGLKAEMKATQAEFKATGNAEKALADKTKILTSQMKTQRDIADNAEKALKEMTNAGIKPTEEAYQKLYVQMMNARAGMNEAQASLNELSAGQLQAATSADKLTGSLNGISKKISLDQVTSGIETITRGLENAAQKAVQLGQSIWDEIMDSARWADDTATMAQMYGIDLDTFLRMQKLVTNGMDTSVEAILTSQSKLERGVASGTETVQEAMQALGLTMTQTIDTGFGKVQQTTLKESTDLFWDAGRAIMSMKDAYKQEEYAQALFGRSWHDLVPLFTQFKDKESFTEALAGVTVESEDTVTKLAALNDKIGELEGNFNTLKTTVLGQLAEPLSQAADAVSGLLTSLLEYLQTPEGQKMLEDLGTAVSGLFDDLGKIDPDKVVKGFTEVFNGVVGSFQWLVTNKETVKGLLSAICYAWGAAKLTGGALTVLQLVNGIRGLTNVGAAAAAGEAGAAAGAAWGTKFASAAAKAAPWLFGAYALLNPAETADSSVFTPEEEAAYNQEHRDEIIAQHAQRIGKKNEEIIRKAREEKANAEYVDLDEAETMLHLTEDQIEAAQAYWDMLRGVATEEQQDMAHHIADFFGMDENSMQEYDKLISLIESLPKSFEDLPEMWWNGGDDIIVEPEIDVESAREQLNANPLTVPVIPQIWGGGSVWGSGGGVAGGKWLAMPKANGIWSVPYDGYLTALHRDEQVVPAREINSRNYSSNLYVESLIMNNGTDADGLAARMAAAQRRTMSGYGS